MIVFESWKYVLRDQFCFIFFSKIEPNILYYTIKKWRVDSTRKNRHARVKMRVDSTRIVLLFSITRMRVDSTRTRVDSTRIILFSITRRRVKSTRTAAHESYRPACRIDTPFFTV
jgi:hypothetical protein